jgi:threonine aldolase
MSIENIRASIRHSTSIHQPRTRLICLENTHNLCGGVVLPDGYVQQVCNMLHTHCFQLKPLQVRELTDAQTPSIAIHMDGARLMNASVVTGQSINELCRHVHSVTFSMCKVSIAGHTL